jgi:hypothetical protein
MPNTNMAVHFISCTGYGNKKDLLGGTKFVFPDNMSRFKNSCLRVQGMSAQIIKAVLSQALLFVSKDQFEIYALAIMAFFAHRIRDRY